MPTADNQIGKGAENDQINERVNKTQRTKALSRTRAIAFIALGVAFAALGSWVSIPIGPIPLTLQMLMFTLIICIYPPTWAVASVAVFVLLGAIGLPLFSGFRGGLGVIMGPTGGFLIGYIPGVVVGACFRMIMGRFAKSNLARIAVDVAAGILFTLVAYLTGWVQYAVVSGLPMEAAFAVSVAPFVIPDLIKVIVAAVCGSSIRRAVKL